MYSTVPDLLESFPRMASTQASSATLSKWLIRASNYIDGYIGGVVPAIPVVPTPPILKDMSEELAQVMFLRRHTHESGKEEGLNNAWKEIINRLENMRNGTFMIFSSSGTVISTIDRNADPWSSVENYYPTFGVSDIEEAETDYDRLTDEAANRSITEVGS